MYCAKPKSLRAASNLKEKTRIWPGCSGGRKLPYTSPRTFLVDRMNEKVAFMVAFHQLVEWFVQHPLAAAILYAATVCGVLVYAFLKPRAQT